MDDAHEHAKDRRRYHLHAATFLVGLVGMLGAVALWNAFEPGVASWIGAGFALVFALSGVFAILVGRTLFSKRAGSSMGFDLDDHPGDALGTEPLTTGFEQALAPYGVLLGGLVFCACFVFVALR